MLQKKIDIKYIFLTIITLGSIFVILPCFHSNVWFDEAYSVGIVSHSFKEIWTIGSNDVHPIAYYFILHIIYLISGGSIVVMRVFSALPLIILAILGYTHIRKDFGEKIGLIFSFLALFMPVCLAYSGEIRMYTWSMLFVTIMSIYAYRIYKKSSTKSWIVFSVFSLISAYTHYYALIIAFLENAMIMGYIIYRYVKCKDKDNILKFIISAVSQIVLYLPWVGAFLGQTKSVSGGFWIGAPDFLQILMFQFTGNLDDPLMLNKAIALIFSTILLAFMLIILVKHIKESKAVQLSAIIYISIIIVIGIISILMQPILYARYFLNLTGLFLFILAFCISKVNNKFIIIIWSTIAILSCIININLIQTNYDKSNYEPFEYIKSNMKADDILVFNNEGAGFNVTTKLNFKDAYFYNQEHWGVEKAYKAFNINSTIESLDVLDGYKGRVWVVTSNKEDLFEEIKNKLENGKIMGINTFQTKYRNCFYRIGLIEN